MTINRYIASCGVCSRRGADELIEAGRIRVNGEVAHAGMEVGEGDVVLFDGRRITPEKEKYYIALNKPRGYITSARDERGRPTVLDLVGDIPARLFPVGRLDYDTSGLLILTNDGEFANLIAHPSHEIYKTYIAHITGDFTRDKLQKLKKGVIVDGQKTAPARAEVVGAFSEGCAVKISIREGRNRQVKKMFKAVGNEVMALKRIAIGPVNLGNLLEGHWRKLSQKEILGLRKCALGDFDKDGQSGGK